MKAQLLGMQFLALLVLGGMSVAHAQTPLTVQKLDQSDPCSGADPSNFGSCGMTAYSDGNYTTARTAWEKAAEHGDYTAALWVGELYDNGNGVQIDYVLAYKWYDIAAAIHAQAISKLPANPDPLLRDTNQTEINYRDDDAKKMSASQIKQARGLSNKW